MIIWALNASSFICLEEYSWFLSPNYHWTVCKSMEITAAKVKSNEVVTLRITTLDHMTSLGFKLLQSTTLTLGFLMGLNSGTMCFILAHCPWVLFCPAANLKTDSLPNGPSAFKSTNILPVCVGSPAENWEFMDTMCFLVMTAEMYFLGIYFLNIGLPLVWVLLLQIVFIDVREDTTPSSPNPHSSNMSNPPNKACGYTCNGAQCFSWTTDSPVRQ